MPPLGAIQACPRPHLGQKQVRVARACLAGQSRGRAVLDHTSLVHHQHAGKTQGLADVVGDAKKRRGRPARARSNEQALPARTLQPAEGLVEDHQAGCAPADGAPEPHSLALAARKQGPARAERRLQAHGQAGQHLVELRGLHRVAYRRMLPFAAKTDVVQERPIP